MINELQALVNKSSIAGKGKEQCENSKEVETFKNFKFYSPFATADDCQLLGEASDCNSKIHDTFNECGIKFLRTTRSDFQLAKTIANELKLRRIIPGSTSWRGRKSYVVLLAEWDTLYGRALPESMEKAFKESLDNYLKEKKPLEKTKNEQHSEQEINLNENSDWLIRLSYLRGVDGFALNEVKPGLTTTDNGKNNKQEKNDALERPQGQSQLDYIRRLADRLVLKQEELRQSGKEDNRNANGRIRAIGILGNDTYDKQLLLQALRPYFPGAVFFTTDLDARLLQPGDFKSTRNLIIASSYRLRLRDNLQKDIPPFRSSYQTALFFSTILALNDPKNSIDQDELDCLIKPRILEVGRHRAFDLSNDEFQSTDKKQCTDKNPDATESNHRLHKTINLGSLGSNIKKIHPEPSPLIPPILNKLIYPGLLSLVLLLLVSDTLKGLVSNATIYVQSKSTRFRAMIFFCVLLLFWGSILYILDIGAAIKETKLGLGEPFSFTEGVSAWPRIILTLIGFVFGVFYLFYAWFMLKKNADSLKKEFYIPDYNVRSSKKVPIDSLPALLEKFIQFWNKIIIFHWHKTTTHRDGQPIKIDQLWHEYCEKGRIGNRLLRTVIPFLVFFFLSILIFIAFKGSHVPLRGEEIRSLLSWSELLTFSLMTFLTFFVVDATRLCHRFVKLIADSRVWPTATRRYCTDRLDIKTCPTEWLYIEFMVKRVSAVAKLINYPIVVLFIMIISRLSYFENWNIPWGLVIVYLLLAAHAIYCAFTLRRVAETVRSTALISLDDKLIKTLGKEDQTNQAQDAKLIEHIIDKIQTIREGPFSPIRQQPVFRTLVPFGGTVGLLILDYVTNL